MTTLTEIEESK